MIEFRNDYLLLQLGEDGCTHGFIDIADGTNYCVEEPCAPVARVWLAGREFPATRINAAGENLELEFAGCDVRAVLRIAPQQRYFIIEVVRVDGTPDQLVFADIRLLPEVYEDAPLAACALALNLQTNVLELPQPNTRLRAICYPRFGLAGAKVAVIGCPRDELRPVMQEVVSAAPDLPHSPLGGPWALDAPINRGSYLFNFGGLTEETVDDWIALARALGFTQIDFHGGNSFRFGDCRPNPQMYPNGRASLKAVIDKLHGAGIAAGFHFYSFFIDKACPWVTPVPDRRLGSDAAFTLPRPISDAADAVPVAESTAKMSAVVGFFVRNSNTLRIDDELITYSGVASGEPFGFSGCTRGACGTRPSAHAAGAKAYHLTECYGYFAPDPESTLFTEVADRIADAYNECGFDMMYLDALDGEDVLGGWDAGWHYGTKFVFELWKRLRKPPLMEMSTFRHHLWFVRSRNGAWDHPTRSYKQFIDNHCEANKLNARMFLPSELGWWALLQWSGHDRVPTYPDDIAYLCCKAIGTDTGMALMGIEPATLKSNPGLQRLAEMIRRHETLRLSGSVPESVKAALREPHVQFELVDLPDGSEALRRVEYDTCVVSMIDNQIQSWSTENIFRDQPLRVRIEALKSAGAYAARENILLTDFAHGEKLGPCRTADGVEANFQPLTLIRTPDGEAAASYTARSASAWREQGTWAIVRKKFDPPIDLSKHQALGLWVYGDGLDEVLNVQLRSPTALSTAIGEHYVVIDFTGWRYFALIEPESERFQEYVWPEPEMPWDSPVKQLEQVETPQHWVSGRYEVYRENVHYPVIDTLSLMFNNLPGGRRVMCHIGPIKALPVVDRVVSNPSVRMREGFLALPVELASGQYLEFEGKEGLVYAPDGRILSRAKPLAKPPLVRAGMSRISFACDTAAGTPTPRARVSIITHGNPLRP